MKILKLYEYVKDPYYNSKLNISKGYKPKYKTGMIAVHFVTIDDQIGKSAKSKKVDPKTGEIFVDYHDSSSNKDFLEYFQDRYDIEYVRHFTERQEDDGWYYYFKCKPGEERKKIEEVSTDKYVQDVDFVDLKMLEVKPKLKELSEWLEGVYEDFGEVSDKKTNDDIQEIIKELQKIIK